jgi:single-stranded-DNA-specific exonuclease
MNPVTKKPENTNEIIWKKRGKSSLILDPSFVKWGKQRNIHPKILAVLAQRGLDSIEVADKFVFGTLKDTRSPLEFGENMNIAIQRLEKAFRNREKIIIVGDYDVDGTTGTAIMIGTLSKLQSHYQFELDYMIPNRFSEGYGLNDNNVDRLISMKPNLVITVDCGISSASQISLLKEHGIDVIVTDHHEPKADIPTDAVAIIHPKFCNYPFLSLSGAGVAYQFCKGIWEVNGKQAPTWVSEDMLDLVALGAVCDIMNIQDDNRIYVKEGIKKLEEKKRLAFSIMGNPSRLNWKRVTPYTLGFQIGPRINAVGRMKTADCVVDMLTSQNPRQIQNVLDLMEDCNDDRKEVQEYIVKEGLKQIENSPFQYVSVVIGDESFHEGVVGIAASKMIETYYRPTFVFAKTEEGLLKGSARSIDDVDLFKVIQQHEEHLIVWGGHHAAAGLTIHPDEVQTFFQKIEETLSSYPPETWIRKKFWDEELYATDLTEDLFHSIFALEPYGQGFPKIIWKAKASIMNKNMIKNEPDKIKGMLSLDGMLVPYIMWENGSSLEVNSDYTLYGYLEWNEFSKQMQFQIIGFE